MNSSDFEKIKKDKNNKEVKITIKSYHCSVCNTFVRNEDKKTPNEKQ